MRTDKSLTLIASAAACALLLSACGSAVEETAAPAASSATSATASASPSASAPAAASPSPSVTAATVVAGAYLTKAEYQSQLAERAGTKVVYFFHATWCSTCKAAEKGIEADGVPAGLTIVKVDFDSERDLRKTYGITVQHTFVQVDEFGDELAKWTGSTSGAQIMDKTV